MTVEPQRPSNGASKKKARLVDTAHGEVSAAKGRLQGMYEAARDRLLEQPRFQDLRELFVARRAQLTKLIGSATENAKAGLKPKQADAQDERALTAREQAEEDS